MCTLESRVDVGGTRTDVRLFSYKDAFHGPPNWVELSPPHPSYRVKKILGPFLYPNPLLTADKTQQRAITIYKVSMPVPRISFKKEFIML